MDIASSSPPREAAALRIARKLRTPLIIAAAAVILFLIGRWGGTVSMTPMFYLGVALLSGLFILFGMAIWWLFLSPLSAQAASAPTVSERTVQVRQMVAVLAVISGLLVTIGGIWDQAWHQVFGGFGDDFLWPPHFTIYGSVFLMLLFALAGLLLLARGTGGLRERFRAEPALGLLGLVSLYVVASVPSDGLWHRVYGLDLNAWSLPHVLMGFTFHLVFISSMALQLSIIPREKWQGLRGITWQHGIALAAFLWAIVTFTQLHTADWEGIRSIGEINNNGDPAFWSRPEWVYPVVLVTLSIYYGNVVLHATRRAGTATLIALAALGVRAATVAVVSRTVPDIAMSNTSHLAFVAPMAALDIWYFLNRDRADETRTQVIGHVAAWAACLAAGLPIIAATMVYPRINASTLPGILFFGLLMALAAGWAGVRVGQWLGGEERRSESTTPIRSWITWASAAALIVAIVAITLYVRYAPLPTPM